MAAIITETFRRNNTSAFINDIDNILNSYYVGLGKSDAWPNDGLLTENDSLYEVVNPIGTVGDIREIRNNITTLIGITAGNYSHVIPNIAAKVNHRHKAYDQFDPDCFYQTVRSGVQMYPCYTVISDNVYLCLRESTNIETSYSLPTGVNTSLTPIQNSDGSIWIYLYSVKPEFPIRGSQFITVPLVPTLNGIDESADISNASGNLVYGFTIIDGGSGYITPPVIEFVSNSNVITPLTVTILAGSVSSVSYPLASWVKAKGYVRVASGNAVIRANIAPANGFGYAPVNDLPSWYAGIVVDAVETIYNDGAYIPYRQLSIVKNPSYSGGTASPKLSLNGLQYMTFSLSSTPSNLTITGSKITQSSTGAIGIVDHYDSVNRYLYYHQNDSTGFIPFTAAQITINAVTYNPVTTITSEYVKQTGDVIFAENRKKITRNSGQTEEIAIILQF